MMCHGLEDLFSCFLAEAALSDLLQDYAYQLRTELVSIHTYSVNWRAENGDKVQELWRMS